MMTIMSEPGSATEGDAPAVARAPTIYVCTTCRPPDEPDSAVRPGAILASLTLEAAAGTDVQVRPMRPKCPSNTQCSPPSSRRTSLGARSAHLRATRPSNTCGGSMTWALAEKSGGTDQVSPSRKSAAQALQTSGRASSPIWPPKCIGGGGPGAKRNPLIRGKNSCSMTSSSRRARCEPRQR